MEANYTQKRFFLGAVVGGIAATLTTLLFTTKQGKRIQKKISDFYEGAEEKVEETLSDAKESVEDGVDQAKKAVASRVKEHSHK